MDITHYFKHYGIIEKMNSINYFQTPEDFIILHTKLDEDRRNIIEQADVVIYSWSSISDPFG